MPLVMGMTLGVVLIAAAALAGAIRCGDHSLARKVALGTLAWLAVYAGLLLSASLGSREEVLDVGERKEFCGFYLDCHLGVTLVDVKRTKTLSGRAAAGTFHVVRLEVSSDAARATLSPHNLSAVVVDERGRRFVRVVRSGEPPMEQRVAPGGSYTRELVFDIPDDARTPRLLVREGNWAARVAELFLISDEDSLLHKKRTFRL